MGKGFLAITAAALGLLVTSEQVASTTSSVTQQDTRLFVQFENELEAILRDLRIPAFSAAIVQNQELVWVKGFGYADLEGRVEATGDTPYRLASLTKPFAALIIMQLTEEGLLDLDDPVSKHGIDIEGTGTIRVRHLLTHTSEGDPGSSYRYNGGRFALLGQVIQRVSGRSFQEILFERILEPLELKSTCPSPAGWRGLDEGREAYCERVYQEVALPYQVDPWYGMVKGYYPAYFTASGGLISTAADLAKLDIAIDENLLVSEKTKIEMFTPALSNAGTELPYGLGWFTQRYQDTYLVWHYGWFPPSVSTLILKVPEENITFIILANIDSLSRNYWLGDGDVLNSPVALTFYKTFIFQPRYGKPLPDIHWQAEEVDLVNQLKQYRGSDVQEILGRELISQAALLINVGKTELARLLLKVHSTQFPPARLRDPQEGPNLAERLPSLIQRQEEVKSEIAARLDPDLDPTVFQAYAGKYEVAPELGWPFTSVSVTSEDEKLYVELPGETVFVLYPESETSFFHSSFDETDRF